YHLIEGGGSSVRRIWIAEGYATALTIHYLTGEAVMVAFSSVNFLSLSSVAHNKYPGYQLIIAAYRDLNGSGQNRAETAAKASQCDIVLPPVFGDWNDALTQYGEESTRKAILEALKPHNASPFDTMSEAEFTAMSVSEKAQRVREHYRDALAVDPNGQLLSRYES
ncbi:toprim domain-containing protein, partial [Cronobacter sakazakii]|uniref:toprim domain-containing protein n=1 Tax=Cronobacter sakazakii TaxID=28141 RepID=UPI00294ADCCE